MCHVFIYYVVYKENTHTSHPSHDIRIKILYHSISFYIPLLCALGKTCACRAWYVSILSHYKIKPTDMSNLLDFGLHFVVLEDGDSGLGKRCAACLKVKIIHYFGKRSSMADGLERRCKICMKNHQHARVVFRGNEVHTNIIDYLKTWRETCESMGC
jgi:hypothetical protein